MTQGRRFTNAIASLLTEIDGLPHALQEDAAVFCIKQLIEWLAVNEFIKENTDMEGMTKQ